MASEEIILKLGDKEGLQENALDTESHLGQLSAGQEAQQCDHFSIRGYVAEVRKKNSAEISWPFELPGENGGFEGELLDVLPPMEVRNWACKRCTQTSHASASPEDVPSQVLETIASGREGEANDAEDCAAVDNQKRELALTIVTDGIQDLEMISSERMEAENEIENRQMADTNKWEIALGVMTDIAQELETTYSRRNDAEMDCENPTVDGDRMETADVTISGSTRVMETQSFGRNDAAKEHDNHPVVDTDVISSLKRRNPPCESGEDQVRKDRNVDKRQKCAKARSTFPLPVEASPTRPQDLNVENQDLEAEIMAFLTQRQLECLSEEAFSADQINPVAPEKIVELTHSDTISAMSMGFQGGSHISRDIHIENSIREGTEGLGYTSAGMYEKAGNSRMPETYSSNYMPATELLQLVSSGICPRLPSPVVHIPDNSASLRIEEGRAKVPGKMASQNSKVGSSSSKSCSSNGQNARGRVGGRNAMQYTYEIPKIEWCDTNKNPADYTVPEPRNRFMISHKDLKRETTEAPKRGRPRKVVTGAPNPNENGPTN